VDSLSSSGSSATSLRSDRPLTSQAVAPSQARIDLIEKGISVFAWLFYSNGVSTVLNDSETLLKPLRYGILLLAMLLLVARWRATLRVLAKGWMLWLLVALTVVSLNWSLTPSFSVESIRGEIIPMSIFAAYFASRFNPREQMKLVAITLAVGAALSLFYAVAVPSVGRHVGDKFAGAWKGIYSQKNNFSTTMTLTIMIFLVFTLVTKSRFTRWLSAAALAFSIGMIILSTSKSGLIIFIAMTLLVLVVRLFRWQGRRSVLLLDLVGLGTLATVSGLSVTWQDIVIGLGRDPTLSARTYIWAGSIEKIMDRPWLGYGRAAFWVPNSLPARQVGALAKSGDFVPAHAHNGFIDIALELGLLGFGLFMLGLLITYGLALRRAYQAAQPEDLWPFTFLTLMVVSNLTETVLMNRVSLYWVLYMVTFLSLRYWPAFERREPPLQLATEPQTAR